MEHEAKHTVIEAISNVAFNQATSVPIDLLAAGYTFRIVAVPPALTSPNSGDRRHLYRDGCGGENKKVKRRRNLYFLPSGHNWALRELWFGGTVG